MFVIVSIPDIAVCIKEMPSIELRKALFMLVIWLYIFVETARPAASSADELMRRPDASLSIDVRCRSFAFVANVLARIALVFVLIDVMHTSPVHLTSCA